MVRTSAEYKSDEQYRRSGEDAWSRVLPVAAGFADDGRLLRDQPGHPLEIEARSQDGKQNNNNHYGIKESWSRSVESDINV